MTSEQQAKARALRDAHLSDELLVLVNAWDAASARVVASAPGCRAVATASWAIAAARGLPDGEAITLEAMLESVNWVAGAVEVPVSADLEGGYGDAGAAAAGAISAGAVGANLEDGEAGGSLRAVAEHAAQVAAARAADGAFVINARTDVFLSGSREVDEAVARGRAYLEAGADCVFVPGAVKPGDISALVAGMGGPISLLATPKSPPLTELARLGVARVSIGPGGMGVALAALRAQAETMYALGPLPADLAFRP